MSALDISTIAKMAGLTIIVFKDKKNKNAIYWELGCLLLYIIAAICDIYRCYFDTRIMTALIAGGDIVVIIALCVLIRKRILAKKDFELSGVDYER